MHSKSGIYALFLQFFDDGACDWQPVNCHHVSVWFVRMCRNSWTPGVGKKSTFTTWILDPGPWNPDLGPRTSNPGPLIRPEPLGLPGMVPRTPILA